MFENCSAYVIAGEQEWRRRLSPILDKIGFGIAGRLGAGDGLAMPAGSVSRLPFLIVHSEVDFAAVEQVVALLRNRPEDQFRFIPIVALLDNRSESMVRGYIGLGCDDIVIYPCTAGELRRRLKHQIGHERDYYRTPDYFGPDRRGTAFAEDRTGSGRAGTGECRHIVISRDLSGAVTILSDTAEDAPEGA